MRLERSIRILLISAAILASAASVFILLSTGEVREYAVSDSESYVLIRPISWFESQGIWGVIVLFLMAGLYAAPPFLYVRGKRNWVFLLGTVAILMTVLAGFSIGFAYLPAAGALLIALILLGFSSPTET